MCRMKPHSVIFLSPILLPMSLPVPQLPWMTSQDFAVLDHFFEFSETTVCGRKSVRELRKGVSDKRAEEVHTTEFSSLNTVQSPCSCSFSLDTFSHSYLRTLALTVISAIRVSSQTSFPWEGLSHHSHGQSFRPSLPNPSLLPYVALLPFTACFAT